MAEQDPLRTWIREQRAQRAVGADAICATCDECRSFALIRRRNPAICFRCDRIGRGLPPYEFNHVFGENNSDATLRRPINDHRAVLSVAQYGWPRKVRENPEGSPVIAAAAMRLGSRDEISYILTRDTSGEFLLDLDTFLRERLGPRWWEGTALEKYAPLLERKPQRGRRSSNRRKGLS
jgi:hypothetical protein